MVDAYIGEVRIFAGNFAPRGWIACDGALLPVEKRFEALFKVLGTTYGGDGTNTFAVPDLRDRAAAHAGTGPGLTPRRRGMRVGTATETLTAAQMPAHTHTARGSRNPADSQVPANALPASDSTPRTFSYAPSNPNVTPFADLQNAGGGGPHNNRQPFLTMMFIICVEGIYPD